MMIPLTFRSVAFVTLCLCIFIGYTAYRASKDKKDYDSITSKLTYLDKKLGDNLPSRDFGKYRYLKLADYPYVFELYSDEQSASVDSLHIGDTVTVYYLENSSVKDEGINRFLQFVDKGNKAVYKTDKTAIYVAIAVFGLSILLNILTFILYKKNKIPF